MLFRKRLAQLVGRHEPADASTQDENGLPHRSGSLMTLVTLVSTGCGVADEEGLEFGPLLLAY